MSQAEMEGTANCAPRVAHRSCQQWVREAVQRMEAVPEQRQSRMALHVCAEALLLTQQSAGAELLPLMRPHMPTKSGRGPSSLPVSQSAPQLARTPAKVFADLLTPATNIFDTCRHLRDLC